MATVLEKATYIAKLNNTAVQFESQLEKRDARAQALDEIMGKGLKDEERKELRDLMDFSIKTKGLFGLEKTLKSHEKNQRKGIESEDVNKYESIDKEKAFNAEKAMKKILELRDRMLKKVGSDGLPLFSKEEIADEIFTPLVREGILPETFVPDEYSETAKLLNQVFADYRKFIEKKKEASDEKTAKTDFEAYGGDDWKKKAKAVGKKKIEFFKRKIDQQVEGILHDHNITATKQERTRGIKIGIAGLKAVMKGKKAVSSLQGLPTEITEALESDTKLLPGYAYAQGDSSGLTELVEQEELAEEEAANPQEIVLMGSVMNSIESALGPEATPEVMDAFAELFDQALNDVATPIRKALASDTGTFTTTMITSLLKTIKKTAMGSIKIATLAKKLEKAEEAMKKGIEEGVKRTAFEVAAVKVSSEMDEAFSAALMECSPAAAMLLDGAFSNNVKTDSWVDQAMAVVKDKDPQKVIDSVGEGFAKAVEKTIKDPLLAEVFKIASTNFTDAFAKRVAAPTVHLALQQGPDEAFAWMTAPCLGAAKAAFSVKEFREKLQIESIKNSLSDSAKTANSKLEVQLLDTTKDIEDFEKQLVLIDEGGIEMAKQQSMVKLTEQLRKDRLILEIVEASGKLLRTVGRGVTSMGVDINNFVVENTVTDIVDQVGAQTLATEIGGQVTAALNAARLIIQLTVNAIRAAERWSIWLKFYTDVELAMKARSTLLPAIENFFNNKKEQIAYHTIEDAMLAIQLAGSITSTVPEPITLAVGKTLTVVGKAGEMANKFGKKVYDEATVRKAWKRTLEAIDNPKNRKKGLQAIHDNILLAAHAVAWAAMNHDPIAEQIMRSCGVNAQTLADSETDAKKIVKYLMLFLSDSGKGEVKFEEALSDYQKININWKPPKVELTVASWFTAKHRGQTLANPKLSDAATKEIDNGLKELANLPTIEEIKQSLPKRTTEELEGYITQVESLMKAFKKYAPVTPDNSKHQEMRTLADQYMELAAELTLEYKMFVENRKQGKWERATPSKN